MVARKVRHGANPAEARTPLTDLLSRHRGDNLEHALVHWDFATEEQARGYVSFPGDRARISR